MDDVPHDPSGRTSYASCGGALIADRYILTAAHCVEGVSQSLNNKYLVALDAHTSRDRQFKAKLKVEKVTVHPKRDKATHAFDIAIIKLEEPVDLKKNSPACLPNFPDADDFFVTGWGQVNVGQSGKKESSQFLSEVDIKKADFDTCARRFGHLNKERQVCAGHLENGLWRGSCQGDSGGPLGHRKGGHVYLMGLVSFGSPDCSIVSKVPNVYERTTAHFDWIKENTKDGKYCRGPFQAIGDSRKNSPSGGIPPVPVEKPRVETVPGSGSRPIRPTLDRSKPILPSRNGNGPPVNGVMEIGSNMPGSMPGETITREIIRDSKGDPIGIREIRRMSSSSSSQLPGGFMRSSSSSSSSSSSQGSSPGGGVFRVGPGGFLTFA